MTSEERGQATVELALCLPLVVVLLAIVVQVGSIALDQVRLWHAAREAVRVAAVESDEAAIKEAAHGVGIEPVAIEIDPRDIYRRRGEVVTVTLDHSTKGRVPVIGLLFSGIRLHAEASMRIEQP